MERLGNSEQPYPPELRQRLLREEGLMGNTVTTPLSQLQELCGNESTSFYDQLSRAWNAMQDAFVMTSGDVSYWDDTMSIQINKNASQLTCIARIGSNPLSIKPHEHGIGFVVSYEETKDDTHVQQIDLWITPIINKNLSHKHQDLLRTATHILNSYAGHLATH